MPAYKTRSNLLVDPPLAKILTMEAAMVRTMKHKPIGEYWSLQEFVLKNGRAFDPKTHFREFECGPMGLCFANSYLAARKSKGKLLYCEGYAMDVIPMPHAWCVTRDGRIVDPTWEEPARDYYGIPIKLSYVREMFRRTKKFGVVDAWELRWPILTRPKADWLEPV